VGPRVGLDDMGKRKFLPIPGLELRLLGHPARSQSLYRLSYPGSKRHSVLYSGLPDHCDSARHISLLLLDSRVFCLFVLKFPPGVSELPL
jgi:hypothetical protein